MPATVSHSLSATTPDDPNYEIRPSHWNSAHAVTLDINATEISPLFSNVNGVSFGTTDGKITASVGTNYAGVGETVTTVAGTNLGLTVDTNGVNIAHPAWLTTAQPVGNYLTTARASNDAVGLNTAKTNVTWTVNSSGLSFDAAGYAGTGFTSGTTAGVDVKATNNTAGLSLAVPAYLTTARASTDAVGLNTAQTNVTWTVNSSGISVNAGGYAGTGTSATNASITLNTNGLAISVAAPSGGTVSSFHNLPLNILTTVGAPINATASILFCPIPQNATGTRLDIAASIAVATAANNSSAAILYSLSAVVYTRTGNTLNSASSGSTASTYTWTSNVTGGIIGGRYISAPVNINASAGNYFVGVNLSTRATGHSGAATTSLGNTITMLGVGTGEAMAVTFGELGAATNSSNGWYSLGLYSSTGNMTQVSMSAITMVGTGFQRANIALKFNA
jgi:hypothetical protein